MKKILLMAGIFLVASALLFGSYIVLLTAWLVLPTFAPPCFMPTSYHLARIRWMVEDPEMAWNDTPEEAVAHFRQCNPDRRGTAMAMLSHEDGSVVSLGMDIVVQESFEDGDALLTAFENDKRWNHHLAFNDEYAKFMLILWKIKRGNQLTLAEKETIKEWSGGYFKKFGLTPPAN